MNIEFIKHTDLSTSGTSVFTSSSVLATFIVCGIFYMLSTFFISKSKSNRLAFFLLISIGLVYVFLEGSPALIFAMLLSLVIFFVLFSSKSMIFVALATVIIPMLPLFYSGVFSGLTEMLENESYRLDIWSAVINMLNKYGFTGIGMGENAFSTLYATYYVGNTTSVPHAHSFVLQTAISLGIPGLLLLFAIVFFVLQGAFSHGRNTTDKRSKNRLYCYSGMCSVFAMFICGITENIAHNPRVFVLFFIMCALCVCARRSAKDTSDSAKLMLEIDENYFG
jgi:putative inorganic carbon (HCO3(-)) transporter